MTLKEQLANDYANDPNSIDEFTPAQKLLMRASFIQGFEKAREMAEKEASHVSLWDATCCRVRAETISNNIRVLGEAEIHDY